MLSRKSVQEDCMRDYISTLTPGCVIDAVVTHMESFGVFADIGAGIIDGTQIVLKMNTHPVSTVKRRKLLNTFQQLAAYTTFVTLKIHQASSKPLTEFTTFSESSVREPLSFNKGVSSKALTA